MALPLALFAAGQAVSRPMEPVPPSVAAAIWLLLPAQAWLSVARLHDRGLSGWWALWLTLPVFAFDLLLRVSPDDPQASRLLADAQVALSLFGLPALLALIVLCGVLPGRRGSDRFRPVSRPAN